MISQTFENEVISKQGIREPEHSALADIDGDGQDDLVLVAFLRFSKMDERFREWHISIR